MTNTPHPRAPRSLADELRRRDDDQLTALLAARPDLLVPVPGDISTLATKAGARGSALRALERLTAFESQVLEALAVQDEPAELRRATELLSGARRRGLGEATRRAVDRLRELALVWGAEDALRVVGGVKQAIGATPAGIGPSVSAALAGMSPARLQELLVDLGLPTTADPVSATAAITRLMNDQRRLGGLLDEAPEAAREVLERLMWGPPFGSVGQDAARVPTIAQAHGPVEWLLARSLLAPWTAGTVVLPREVALHLRCHVDGRGLFTEVSPTAPRPTPRAHDQERVDSVAAGQAHSVVRAVETLLESWSAGGPPVLRSGGVGVRELRRTATTLDVSETEAALVLELAWSAGLLGRDGEVDEMWLPTTDYDRWLLAPVERRWLALVEPWLATTRVAGLVGERDKERLIAALGPGLDRPNAPTLRRAVLRELASLPAGASTTTEDLVAALEWRMPRRGGTLRQRLVDWTLHEADWLGVTGMGALSGHGRALLDGDTDGALTRLAALLPKPVDHVLLQADLTAVAPGPLTTELARTLALIADVESSGAATVYRFTADSVRRALDSGYVAADLHELLAAHSRTPVPQPLDYLIDDVARRHGTVRVGTASAYLRCDDETVIHELMVDRRLAALRPRRLAPTVLVTQLPVDMVLDQLRAAGYAPAAEAPDGAVLTARPSSRRAEHGGRPEPVLVEPPLPDAAGIAAVVRLLRAADSSSGPSSEELSALEAASPALPRLGATEVLVELLQAAADERSLWISYVDAEGRATRRIIDPIQVGDGRVTAYDHLRAAPRSFALHRITGLTHADSPTEQGSDTR